MSELPIQRYQRQSAAFHPWDPRTVEVAAEVGRLVASACPGVEVEHVGSSSVRGLPGKNIVDLGIEASPDEIPGIADALVSLGFQRQGGLAPFPPTRPLLLGMVEHDGTPFRIHLHVMPPARHELAELCGFRDALRTDAALRSAYAAEKQRIVDEAPDGDPGMYTVRKVGFILDTLYARGIRRPPVDAPEPLAPGSVIGILGGGQLGQMLASSARAMGYRVRALDPNPHCPSAGVVDELVVAAYDDIDAARRLAEASDVVTYELEHVGLEAAAAAGELAPLRPGLASLRATQDRLAERRFIREIGEWAAPGDEVHGPDGTLAALERLGYPARLKAPMGGYDGRSQVRITGPDGVAAAISALGGDDGRPLLLEQEIDFEAELSVVCARDRTGRTLSFPVSRNVHDAGILVESVAPAPIDPIVENDATEIADSIARGLDLVGVLTVELFQLRGGGLMINELAPRVHNSGHWTIEGASTSQFEQHIRAIAGLPLGSPEPHGAAAMVNLLGTGVDRPARLLGLERALVDPAVHVHVYDKRRVFERRKMGHVTVVGHEIDDVLARAHAARAALRWDE
jgi:5-(carboxyamino)imidazole ribonucleotide synthase